MIDTWHPRVSIIINTDGRRESLTKTLESLKYQSYDNFEICVVVGPTKDGTVEKLQSYGAKIKTAQCEQHNLSMSRNIGIRLAAGEIVAFVDDDGMPEAEWLERIVAPFAADDVGACGGPIYDQTGYSFQHQFVMCDRLGRARHLTDAPVDDLSHPHSLEFPAATGTNSVFRRKALQEIGGFDEEYEYYLDETDVCCRLVDAGWRIRHVPSACVHHKFLPSRIRSSKRVTKPYSIIKNKLYFSLVHATRFFPLDEVLSDCVQFSKDRRHEYEDHVRRGHAPEHAMEAFEQDAEAGWRDGLLRGLSSTRRRCSPAALAGKLPFKRFEPLLPSGERWVLVFLSQDYPPSPATGVSRYTHDIARALAQKGHGVHVLTRGADLNTVDLEDGVWVHRLVPIEPPVSLTQRAGTRIPINIGSLTAAYAEEIGRLGRYRRIDVVEAPSWDVEGLGVLLKGEVPVVVNIVTTLSIFLETHPELRADKTWMKDYGHPVMSLEKKVFSESSGIIAASRSIFESIKKDYNTDIKDSAVAYVPHLSKDRTGDVRTQPKELRVQKKAAKEVAFLFVGRLEARKGIDTILGAMTRLADEEADIRLWVAGDPSHRLEDGTTAKQKFQAHASSAAIAAVSFLGQVTDEELVWLLHECDAVVVPSRFESFGLVAIEAMMFGKSTIASEVGGLAETVRHEKNGLLVAPDNPEQLADAMKRLAGDKGLRERLGRQARQMYEADHSPPRLVDLRLKALSKHFRVSASTGMVDIPKSTDEVVLPFGRRGWRLRGHEPVTILRPPQKLWLRMWRHAWSGIIEIRQHGSVIREVDLFADLESAETIEVTVAGDGNVDVYWAGRSHARSKGQEAILMDVLVPRPFMGNALPTNTSRVL